MMRELPSDTFSRLPCQPGRSLKGASLNFSQPWKRHLGLASLPLIDVLQLPPTTTCQVQRFTHRYSQAAETATHMVLRLIALG